jgi:hypothetical protein
LTVAPSAACLIALIRVSGHDCAATRRAPPILTLNMVFGALKVLVSSCSSKAARATLKVDGASPNAAPAAPSAEPINEEDAASRLRDGRSHGTRMSTSVGSSDSVRMVIRSADTPSIRA